MPVGTTPEENQLTLVGKPPSLPPARGIESERKLRRGKDQCRLTRRLTNSESSVLLPIAVDLVA